VNLRIRIPRNHEHLARRRLGCAGTLLVLGLISLIIGIATTQPCRNGNTSCNLGTWALIALIFGIYGGVMLLGAVAHTVVAVIQRRRTRK
jgi:hypothetical protein